MDQKSPDFKIFKISNIQIALQKSKITKFKKDCKNPNFYTNSQIDHKNPNSKFAYISKF